MMTGKCTVFPIAVALSLVLSRPRFVSAIPESVLRARHVQTPEKLRQSYDYIIVGAGTAGLTIADRLTESPKYTVLVIEHGEFWSPSDPTGDGQRAHLYNLTSVPQIGLDNRTIPLGMGFGVGGSSAVNGMAVMRGTVQDYNIWAVLGNKGSAWTWEGLLPYFRKAIRFVPPDPVLAADFNITYDTQAAWGQYNDTHVYASFPGGLNPVIKTIYNGLRKTPGIPFPVDGHAGSHGVFYYPLSVNPKTRQRSYSRTGHWDSLNRSNYDILTSARATKVLLNKINAATGVEFILTGAVERHTVKANKEVVVSTGTIHTPQLLQLSGIGPHELLKQAKIPLKVNLPGVGANFQDHPIGASIRFNFTKTPPRPTSNSTHLPPSEGQGQGLVADLSLPIAAPLTFSAIASSLAGQNPASFAAPGTDRSVLRGYKAQNDLLAHQMLSSTPGSLSFLHWVIGYGTAPGANPINFHITSRGTITIDPANPDAPDPIVDYRALTNPVDTGLMIAYIEFYRRFFGPEGALAQYRAVETAPGAHVTSRKDLARYIRANYIPQAWHPVGTAAKMRREWGGVVDDELRVYGTKRLRVADASIIPILPGGTTQLTVYMIGEKVSLLSL
ncbi:putative GMC oxidoreductase [Triangularia setosa]|uniref:GMC oxidoreductase n=1 Tax=Triangularia setosa TaxID=2587417 RepID=A0AAN6WEH1_9PEZI|nr:putative GMC oxidoreductase [Podospora setosa]